MKNITIYTPAKYNTDKYTKVKDNIYKTYDNFMKQDSFVTSLSFEQEPEYEIGRATRLNSSHSGQSRMPSSA